MSTCSKTGGQHQWLGDGKLCPENSKDHTVGTTVGYTCGNCGKVWDDNEDIIPPGSAFGKEIGFTLEDFDPFSYLYKIGDSIWVSFIELKGSDPFHPPMHTGKFRTMVETIRAKGLKVKIACPLARMEEIVTKCGYTKVRETVEGEEGDVWVAP